MTRNISFSREPAVWIAVIKAGIYAGMLFGLGVSAIQLAGIVAFFETVGTVIQRQTSFAPMNKDGAALVGVKYEGGKIQAVK